MIGNHLFFLAFLPHTKEGLYSVMIATFINAGLVLLGSILGLLLQSRIPATLSSSLTRGLALCVMLIGIMGAIETADILCVIVCMAIGIFIGEALRIEDRLATVGDLLRTPLARFDPRGKFTEGFVSATVLYCVGAMAIMGSIEAGLNGNYSIIIAKGVIDGVVSISLASTLGVGVAFSTLPLILYQGAFTLLAHQIGPLLDPVAVNEMSAVGSLVILAIGFNMLECTQERIRVGNMLPVIFLPLLYCPVSQALSSFFAA